MNKFLAAVLGTALIVGPLSYEIANSKPADTYKQLDLFTEELIGSHFEVHRPAVDYCPPESRCKVFPQPNPRWL